MSEDDTPLLDPDGHDLKANQTIWFNLEKKKVRDLEIDSLAKERDELRRKLKTAREALEFYRDDCSTGADDGDVARTVLKKIDESGLVE